MLAGLPGSLSPATFYGTSSDLWCPLSSPPVSVEKSSFPSLTCFPYSTSRWLEISAPWGELFTALLENGTGGRNTACCSRIVHSVDDFHPFPCYPGLPARTWRRPFPRCGVASPQRKKLTAGITSTGKSIFTRVEAHLIRGVTSPISDCVPVARGFKWITLSGRMSV